MSTLEGPIQTHCNIHGFAACAKLMQIFRVVDTVAQESLCTAVAMIDDENKSLSSVSRPLNLWYIDRENDINILYPLNERPICCSLSKLISTVLKDFSYPNRQRPADMVAIMDSNRVPGDFKTQNRQMTSFVCKLSKHIEGDHHADYSQDYRREFETLADICNRLPEVVGIGLNSWRLFVWSDNQTESEADATQKSLELKISGKWSHAACDRSGQPFYMHDRFREDLRGEIHQWAASKCQSSTHLSALDCLLDVQQHSLLDAKSREIYRDLQRERKLTDGIVDLHRQRSAGVLMILRTEMLKGAAKGLTSLTVITGKGSKKGYSPIQDRVLYFLRDHGFPYRPVSRTNTGAFRVELHRAGLANLRAECEERVAVRADLMMCLKALPIDDCDQPNDRDHIPSFPLVINEIFTPVHSDALNFYFRSFANSGCTVQSCNVPRVLRDNFDTILSLGGRLEMHKEYSNEWSTRGSPPLTNM